MDITFRIMDFIVYFPVFSDMYPKDSPGLCQLKNGVPHIQTRQTTQPKDSAKRTDNKAVHNMIET